MNIEKTIVAFHIGRGGRFNSQGHKTFIGQDVSIEDYTNDLFIGFENSDQLAKDFEKHENLTNLLQACFEDDKLAIERLTKWGFKLGELVYKDCNGNEVGLTVEEAKTGIGLIDQDGEYDTTYTCYLEECDDNELQLIYDEIKDGCEDDFFNYVFEKL